jgi:hypothetical protein
MSANLSRPRSTRLFAATIAATMGGAMLLAGCGGGDDEAAKTSAVQSPPASDAAQDAAEAPKPAKPYAGQTPAEIYKTARTKMMKAKSVHMKVKIPKGKDAMDADLLLSRAGKATGTISTPADGSMKLILMNTKKGYFLPGKDMYEKLAGGNDSVVEMLTGKWIAFGKNDGADDFFQMANMKVYTNDMLTPLTAGDHPTRSKGKLLAGRKTIALKEKGNSSVVYVAADGSGELVAVKDPDGLMTFSGWNEPVKAQAPKKSMDLKDFQ